MAGEWPGAYLNGKPLRTRIIADHLVHSMVYGRNKSHWAQHPFYVGRMHDYFFKDFAVDELRIYNRCLTPLEMPAWLVSRTPWQKP